MLGDKAMIAPNCVKNWMSAEPSQSFQTAATGSNRSASQSASNKMRWRIESGSTG